MFAQERTKGGASRTLQLFRGLLRQSRGSIVLFTSILFAIYTLPILIGFFSENRFFYWAEGLGHNFSAFSFVMFLLYIMIVPISLGVKHYGFMHKKQAVDLYHALPVKRSELYLASTGVGTVILTVPIVINFGLVMMLQLASGNGHYTPDALINMLFWLVAGYVVMAITGLCAVHAGTGVDTALFSMAVNGAPTAIYLLNQLIKENMLYGFIMGEGAYNMAAKLSPIASMLVRELDTNRDIIGFNSTLTMFVWLVIGIALTALSIVFYRKRKSEDAELVGNFGPAQIVIRLLVYYLGAIVFGVIFDEIFWSYDSHSYFIVGVGVGALLTGLIGELILTRSARLAFRRMPIALGVAAVAILSSYIYTSNGFGFETYVPDAGSVASVRISFDDGYPYVFSRYGRYTEYEDRDVVELVTQIHATQIEAYQDDPHTNRYSYSNSFVIHYTMRSGKVVSRRYYSAYDDTAKLMAQLAQTPGYARQASEFFQFEASQIGSVTLMSPLMDNSTAPGLTASQKADLLAAIRADLTARDAEAIAGGGAEVLGIIAMRVGERDWNEVRGDIPEDATEQEIDELESYYFEYYRNYYEDVSLTLYGGDRETLGFLRQHGLDSLIAFDYGDVTSLHIVDSESRYYYDSVLVGLNPNYAEQMSYALGSYYDPENNYYYRDRILPVAIDRLDELVALSHTTVLNVDDFVVIAMGTEDSTDRVGYRFVRYDDLPEDLAAQFERVRYGEFWTDRSTNADDDWGFEDWDENTRDDSEAAHADPFDFIRGDDIPSVELFESAIEALATGQPGALEWVASLATQQAA